MSNKLAFAAMLAALAFPAQAKQADVCSTLVEADAGRTALTPKEQADGWRLLWDGKSAAGWRSAKADAFPASGWDMCKGVLSIAGKDGEESRGPGDIITVTRHANFELQLEFKLTPGANSGIKIFTQPNLSPIDKVTGKPTGVGSAIGMEYQILDDALHPDARMGRDGNRKLASLYDVLPAASDKTVRPIGQWNQARIVSKGTTVSYWLNGVKTLEYERGAPAFRAAVARSKFADIAGFGEWADGHILLQDHGDRVSYRNIMLRDLRP